MKVFIAAPITSALLDTGPNNEKRLDPDLANFLCRLEKLIVNSGHEVFMAHRVEQFGASVRPPHICTPLDFLAIKDADCLVAFPQLSYGVHMELGWATALRKPIILIREEGGHVGSPLLNGLSTFGTCREITAPVNFLADDSKIDEVCHKVLSLLSNNKQRSFQATSVAFLTTAFGFGPVSKAVTIAAEFKRLFPGVELNFFGAGIDFDFAAKANVFDHIFRYDVDTDATLAALSKYLITYDHVVSVLNFAILHWWDLHYPPLYVVDSLAWMWPSMPSGLEKASCYFVQDYLLPTDRVKKWTQSVRVVTTGPICSVECPPATSRKDGKLLVSFSGCANPLLAENVYYEYIRVLSEAILDVSQGLFEEVLICTRESLHHVVLACEGMRPGIRVAHLPHDRFIKEMSDCSVLLTSPGITTTIEALRLNTPVGFLPPQNYSQCLLAEQNLDTFGPSRCMALSRFGEQYRIKEGLPEVEGVMVVARFLEEICKNNPEIVRHMLYEMLTTLQSPDVRIRPTSLISEEKGQKLIVQTIMSNTAGNLLPRNNRRRS